MRRSKTTAQLVRSPRSQDGEAAARREDLELIDIERLSRDFVATVRSEIARHATRFPAHVAERLAEDSTMVVRGRLYGNPACPVNILEAMATNRSVSALLAVPVVSNPSCPASVLRFAIDHPSFAVRVATAGSPNIDDETLRRALSDSSPNVVTAAMNNSRITPAMVGWIIVGWTPAAARRLVETFEHLCAVESRSVEALLVLAETDMSPDDAFIGNSALFRIRQTISR